ncbi:MAG: PKD domain-containing protein, partial [Methanoregula sp.]
MPSVSLTPDGGPALQAVAVAPPVVSAFTVNRTAGATPLTVQFYDKSTGYPTSWSWDFGDGSTST